MNEMKFKMMSFFSCVFAALSYGDSSMLFTFDNSTSNDITLSSVKKGGVNAIADTEVGKAVIKFDSGKITGDLKINVHSRMKDAYLFVIEDGNEFQNKKLFEIRNDHDGKVLATLKIDNSGQLILDDQTLATIGLYRNANGAYQLVVADDIETFLSCVRELFKKAPGMPQQWFRSK